MSVFQWKKITEIINERKVATLHDHLWVSSRPLALCLCPSYYANDPRKPFQKPLFQSTFQFSIDSRQLQVPYSNFQV